MLSNYQQWILLRWWIPFKQTKNQTKTNKQKKRKAKSSLSFSSRAHSHHAIPSVYLGVIGRRMGRQDQKHEPKAKE